MAAREQSLEQSWEKKYGAKIRELEARAAELSAQFEKQAQETIGDLSQKARVKITKTRREFQEAVEAAIETVGPKRIPPAGEAPRLKLAEGVRVRLKGIRQPATVRRILANGLLEVDAGFLKMKIPDTEVEEVLAPATTPAVRPNVSFRQGPSFEGNFREINLIGQRAEDACRQVDKLLDSAALAEVDRIRIVHGHGMGILKKAVADLLARHPHVEKFYVAPPEEGGSGATIVELKA